MKIKILPFILFLAALMPSLSFAHSGSLTGVVFSSFNKIPIQQAKIRLANTNFETVTDENGRFSFLEIPARNYTLRVEMEGFYTNEKEVDLESDKALELTIYMYPTLINLPDFAISSKKAASAASTSTLGKIDFELRQKNTAQDMLRLVPGLFIAQHAGGGKAEQIFIRGFDCDHGTDVATFVDGIPVNMPSHGHGQGYADLHFLIPETVKNIDVFKGPYFAEFGDFATGAAVQFNTLDSLQSSQATLEFGSVPSKRAISSNRLLLMANIPTGKDGVRSYIANELVYTPGYFESNQQFLRYNLFNKTSIQLSNSSSLALSVSGFGSSWNASGQVPERAVASGQIGRFGSIDNTEGGTTQRINTNIQYNSIGKNRQFESNFFTSNYRFKLFSNFTFFANNPLRGDQIEQSDNRFVSGINTKYKIFYDAHGLEYKTTVGGGFRSDNIENSLWNTEKRARFFEQAHAKITQNNMNIFVKQDVTFNDWLRADVALRGNYMLFDVQDLRPESADHKNYSGFNYQFLPSYKANLIFTPAKNIQFFVNHGTGFHSNDARSSVQEPSNHRLPQVMGSEIGSQINLLNRIILNVALWRLDSENELVYVGDDGTTENKGSSRRTGIDISVRGQLYKWLYADCDLNFSRNILTKKYLGEQLPTDNLVPLAPTLTSTGGLTARSQSGLSGSVRYRFIGDRAANESNTTIAKGYFLTDLAASYKYKNIMVNLTVENLLNVKWNEAQFDTESRLKDEPNNVTELHFTPGTPLALKAGFSWFF